MSSVPAHRALGACLLAACLVATGCVSSGDPPASDVPGPPDPSGPILSVTPPPGFQVPGGVSDGTGITGVGRLPTTQGDGAALGPPSWVQPGMRLTWYGAAASVAQSSYTYVEDAGGEWEDPTTGKRYRRTDPHDPDNPEDMPTAAGEAYTQTDVIAVEGDDVVLSNTLYGIDLIARQYTLQPLGGGRVPGAAVDGGWVNPDLMQTLLTTGYQGLMILRGPYLLNGQQFDGVAFVARSEGSYASSTFDAASGVLLSMNASVEGGGAPVHGPLDDPQGNVQLSLSRFVSARQRTIPGMDAAAPAWVATTPELVYDGTYTATNPLDPTSGPWVWPMRQTVTFGDGGRTWSTFSSHTVIDLDGMQQPSDGSGVTGPTGLYWYDPATLASMSQGDVIDEDPVTGARTTVESVGGGGSGAVVTITTAMDGITLRLGYDVGTGVLVSLALTQSVTGATVALQLTTFLQ
jgi:hypothetical protein